MNATDLVEQSQLRDGIPDFAPGDTLKVHVKVTEGTFVYVAIDDSGRPRPLPKD